MNVWSCSERIKVTVVFREGEKKKRVRRVYSFVPVQLAAPLVSTDPPGC